MTLGQRLMSLGQLTLQDPRAAARALLAEDVPLPARTAGLLLVAVLSALLAGIQTNLQPREMDPISSFMLASPLRGAVVQWLLLALSVFLIHRVGAAFGGKGNFADALLVVVWLQVIMIAVQILQLLAMIVAPPIAGFLGLFSLFLFFFLMTSFVAELHGFASRGAVFAGILGTGMAVGLLIAIGVVLVAGPEAFLTDV